MPPTERKGRVHTSTVTVAVIKQNDLTSQSITTQDVEVEWFSGTGAGGQHRNKHQNSCRIKHVTTGTVTVAQCRSRMDSYKQAMQELQRRVDEQYYRWAMGNVAATKKVQVGSGMRGDKIRTYRFQDDIATDHRNGKKVKLSKVLDGGFNLLW